MNKYKLPRWLPTAFLLAAIVAVVAFKNAPQAVVRESEHQNHTARVQQFNLNEMTARAGHIFRGTVIDFSPQTVSVGGADLPAVTYQIRVDRAFKGSFVSKGDVSYIEITMLGSVKATAVQHSLQHLAALPTPPQLRVGGDYLLLTTPASDVGLTTTVGLGQGSFELFSMDKQLWAENEYHNAGLADGPILYSDLAAQIEQQVGE